MLHCGYGGLLVIDEEEEECKDCGKTLKDWERKRCKKCKKIKDRKRKERKVGLEIDHDFESKRLRAEDRALVPFVPATPPAPAPIVRPAQLPPLPTSTSVVKKPEPAGSSVTNNVQINNPVINITKGSFAFCHYKVRGGKDHCSRPATRIIQVNGSKGVCSIHKTTLDAMKKKGQSISHLLV